MYFSFQWWGTGSIIDNKGHILTNNHVVDNGFGDISDDFAICVTDDPGKPPRCHYTASVVARDVEKDVALLVLDPKDIFGNPVDFSAFSALSLDYNYTVQAGDAVSAQGYPWVGANTITQTQWIVSGTYTYNNNTYIKTDTLIAGWNSGWPLIREGKMVGVNTFLIGGFFDPALGYSLSVREIQSFLQWALSSVSLLQKNSPGFGPFLRSVNEFSEQQKFVDPLITIRFPEKYTIMTHIPGYYVDGQIAQEKSTAVYGFSFLHFRVPALKTPEEIRYFLAWQSFFPFWEDVKFTTVTIGGQTFYQVDNLGNTAGDKTKTQYVYFKIVDNTHLLLLRLSTPFSNESTYDAIQKNLSAFLAGITFPANFSFADPGKISITDAHMAVSPGVESLIDFRSNFFPYNGAISQLMTTYDDLFTVRKYLGNLWSYAQVSIVPNSFYTENTSAEELLRRLREVPYFSQNTDTEIVHYKGRDGFMVCDKVGSSVGDEKNIQHTTAQCEVILLIGENDSHFLSLIFLVDRRQKWTLPELMISHLDSMLHLSGEGLTHFGSGSLKLSYTDVANQSQEFQESLKYLLKYGVLASRNLFDGDHPLTWEEYIRLHVWMIYHKRLSDTIVPGDSSSPTFSSIISTLPIDRRAFVDSSQRESFDLMLRMALAGVQLPKYSASSLNQFKVHAETTYRDHWLDIEEFEYQYFMGRKMAPNGTQYYDTGYYMSDFVTYYNPITGISQEPVVSDDEIQFGVYEPSLQARRALEAELACTKNVTRYFSAECFRKRQEYVWSSLSYPVLTKGEAVSALLVLMDFALWDEELARKKMVQVDNEN